MNRSHMATRVLALAAGARMKLDPDLLMLQLPIKYLLLNAHKIPGKEDICLSY